MKALKECNYNLPRLRESLLEIKSYDGVTGITSIASDGGVIKDLAIKKITPEWTIISLEKVNLLEDSE